MAGTAYHMEALRKARLNERKTDAVRKLQDSLGQGGAEYIPISVDENPEPLVFSEPGQYLTNSKAEWIRHRRCRALNEGEDKVLPIMHPREYNFKVASHELPPRKPHFKV